VSPGAKTWLKRGAAAYVAVGAVLLLNRVGKLVQQQNAQLDAASPANADAASTTYGAVFQALGFGVALKLVLLWPVELLGY
jgi:hypothetical protein